MPLWYCLWERDDLDTLFQCCNKIKNALISKKKKVLRQLERTKAWKKLRADIAASYKAEESEKDPKLIMGIQSQRKALFQQRNSLLDACGLTAKAFEADIKPMQHHYRKIINSQVAQKLAADVWKKFEEYLYGNAEDIHFSKITDFTTIEGKNNATGIYYRDGVVHVGKKLRLSVVRNRNDRYGYETEALSRKVHYCKLVRRPGPDGWRYFVQLVLSGKPPVKVDQRTGEIMHTLGKGRVGNDIGPQTLATVSDNSASLVVFCERAQDIQKELRRINRAMDRSRRDTNPQMFNDKSEIIAIDKLPDACVVTSRGMKRRNWIESKRYKQLAQYRRYLYSKQTDQRIQSHNELTNKLIPLGDEHYIEKMNWQALSKRAKKTEVSEKTGKCKRKKRFGKSIANKAPGLFVKIYERKVKAAGGQFHRIDTVKARASQYNHESKAYRKKHLSQRWNIMTDGSKIQRDLYSAFLLQNSNEALDGFIQSLLDQKFGHFKILHDAEIERLTHIPTPSSTGIKKIA